MVMWMIRMSCQVVVAVYQTLMVACIHEGFHEDRCDFGPAVESMLASCLCYYLVCKEAMETTQCRCIGNTLLLDGFFPTIFPLVLGSDLKSTWMNK